METSSLGLDRISCMHEQALDLFSNKTNYET